MNTYTHTVGAQYKLANTTYELVAIENDFYHLRSFDFKKERSLQSATFEQNFAQGKIKLVKKSLSDVTETAYFQALTTEKQKKLHRKLQYVEKVRRTFGAILPKKHFDDFIKLVSKELNDDTPPSFSTLNRWFLAYRESNFNPASQLTLHDKKRGTRKRRIDNEVLEFMHDVINEFYLTLERPSMQFAYNIFQDHFLSKNQSLPQAEQIKIPSLMTFQREISKLHPMTVTKARHGKRTARKTFDYGKSLQYKSHLCIRVESDTYPVDIIALDEESRIVGHPYLTAFMDVYTRCILGWDLSFIPPCAEKTLRALRHAGTDANNREVGGMPIELVLDNGSEFVNESLNSFALNTGITLLRNPPGTPNQKGHIESFFKTVASKFLASLPGKTFGSPKQRENYDSEKNARITISELQAKFALWIDTVYHFEKHSGLHSRAPISVWREEYQKLPTIRHSDEILKNLALSVEKRVINHGRVKMFGLSWTGPSLPIVAEKLKTRGRNSEAQIMYDSSDLSTIWVIDPDAPAIFYEAHATRPLFQHNLSLYEHNLLKKSNKFNDSEIENQLVKNRIEFHKEIKELSRTHKSARKQISKMEKAQQLLGDEGSEFMDTFRNQSYKNDSLKNDHFNESDFPDDGFLL